MESQSLSPPDADAARQGGFTNAIVRTFLHSNLPLLLLILASVVGLAALLITPREEDPQIVVPMADVFVNFPGRSAGEVEQLAATPLERILYQIDGVEYVYSMSRPGQAVITVRFLVGEDRERSLVKLLKKINENLDAVPPGVTGWVIKPVEIDDVPVVTLTLASRRSGEYVLRRVGEELAARLAAVPDVSRAYVVGGQPRIASVRLDAAALSAYSVDPLDVRRAIQAASVAVTAGDAARNDTSFRIDAAQGLLRADQLNELVVGVFDGRPVFLKDVAKVVDGPDELVSYVRHSWGPARAVERRPDAPAAVLGAAPADGNDPPAPAVTLAFAKKKGANAVRVANLVVAAADSLRRDVVPDDVQLIVTRNTGLASNDKVNELVEALAVALLLASAVLLVGMGWRESLIVALAVPVVFGLTLAINLLSGYTINRVTLFALILALGLLVDDPIVDVENIARHFSLRRRASRGIVLEAVSEIRPPLISATIAVILSFLPMLFITGMMGPYMRPMALNVPVAMVMSMVVAFTITPWLTYHFLKRRYHRPAPLLPLDAAADPHGLDAARRSPLYGAFRILLEPLLRRRWAAWAFLAVIGLLMAGAVTLAATRRVPLKMLPFGNRNDFQLVLDANEGATLERTDAAVRQFEQYLRTVPEVADIVSYVGLAAPMDFNGMVRHYYLRSGPNVADLQVNLADRKWRTGTTHEVTLRIRRDLTAIARRAGVRLKLVEPPPGPPVYATLAAEIYGRPGQDYDELLAAARTVEARFAAEEGVVDVDSTIETPWTRLTFVPDLEKAAISGISAAQIADTLRLAVQGDQAATLRVRTERNPLQIVLRLPRAARSSPDDLLRLHIKGTGGQLVSLAELGRWDTGRVDQAIYHKNLQPLVYVFGEVAGRTPAEAVADILADQRPAGTAMPASAAAPVGSGWISTAPPRPAAARSFVDNGAGVAWALPAGLRASFAGEGEWQLTIDVFRDMGLAFLAAVAAIYILLVGQTRSFVIPLVIMLAIPLTIIGIMPGFWLLNAVAGRDIGGYHHGVFFTATAMIGMIALAGIVTRNAIILVDFIHLSLRRGRPLADSIIDSAVVRIRPILLTAATALLSALPIVADPIFSGLAWALIFGLLASTAFTLLVVPVVYWLLYARKPGHGLPADGEEDEA